MANSVKQLSIFLENKAGSLNEILELLSRANIHIIASTLSDTTEYGILRLITNDNVKADAVLKESRKNSTLRDVIALEYDSSAGSLHKILQQLSNDALSVEYMYCFTMIKRSIAVLRMNDTEAALRSIEKYGFTVITDSDLKIAE